MGEDWIAVWERSQRCGGPSRCPNWDRAPWLGRGERQYVATTSPLVSFPRLGALPKRLFGHASVSLATAVVFRARFVGYLGRSHGQRAAGVAKVGAGVAKGPPAWPKGR